MSKKDYELIAAALREEFARATPLDQATHDITVAQVANSIANALAKDNSAFNKDRFITACGVTD